MLLLVLSHSKATRSIRNFPHQFLDLLDALDDLGRVPLLPDVLHLEDELLVDAIVFLKIVR